MGRRGGGQWGGGDGGVGRGGEGGEGGQGGVGCSGGDSRGTIGRRLGWDKGEGEMERGNLKGEMERGATGRGRWEGGKGEWEKKGQEEGAFYRWI